MEDEHRDLENTCTVLVLQASTLQAAANPGMVHCRSCMALALQAWQEYCRAVTLSIHPPRQVSSGKLEKKFCIHVEIAHMLLKAGANLDAICRARRYDLRFSHQGPPSVETPPCMVRKTSHPEATPFPTISWRYYSCSPDHPLQPSPAGVWWQAGIIGGVKRCSRHPEPDVRRERTLQSRMSHESPMLWSPQNLDSSWGKGPK